MKCITALLTIFTIALFMILSPSITLPQEKQPNWQVYFSPKGGCTEAIIRELDKARNTILVQAYSFTSASIAKALLNAHKRGVKVEVILDKSQRTDQYSSATFLFNAGIPVKIDAKHAIAHNKVMIIDGETVWARDQKSSKRTKLLQLHWGQHWAGSTLGSGLFY